MRGQRRGLCGAAIAALVAGHPALAQEETGGLQMSLGVTERLEATQGAGQLTANTTSLSFGLSSETRTQLLQFNLSGALRFEQGDGAAEPDRFDNPSFSALYRISNTNSALTLQANAAKSALSQATPTADDPDPQGTGTRLQHSAAALLELGVAAPLGLTLQAGRSGADYSEAGETDSQTLSYSATAHLRFASGAEARVTALREDYSEGEALDLQRQTTDLSLGWTQPLSPVLTLDAAIGQQRVHTISPEDVTQGLSGRVGLSAELANGAASLSFDQSQEPGAARQTVTASRSFDLGTQSLSLSLGVTRQGNAAPVAIGNLRWAHDGGVGAVSMDLGRSVTSGGLGVEVTTDRLALGLSREVGASGRLSLGLTAARIDDSSAPLVERTDLSASYSRDLGPDWQMSFGANMTRREQEGDASTTSRTIFLSLSRNFNLRP